jgi:pyruvate dehydrogenase E1 component beta subunit
MMGEDISGGMGAPGEQDAWGGPLGVTKGIMPVFTRDRVLDTPITESAFIGAAAGAAATGLRPVAELMFVDFMGVCFDQIFNQAAKFKYMFGGKAITPLVIRTMYGAGFRAASQHSQCLYPLFTHIPGLKVVLPSNAYEAKGLLAQAIRDDDPVIFFEHKAMYDEEMEVPDEAYTIPFGEANVTREGDDVTIVAFGDVPFRDHAFLHGEAPFRHHDHLDGIAHGDGVPCPLKRNAATPSRAPPSVLCVRCYSAAWAVPAPITSRTAASILATLGT